MPNGNEVVAVTHDGVEHHFPAGTPDATVDTAIKGYLNPPKDPYGFSTTGTGGGPEAEMLRRHARSRAGKDFGPEKGVVPWLLRQGGGALETTGELAKAVPGMLKTTGDIAFSAAPGLPSTERTQAIQSLVQPQVEQWQKGATTTGAESLAHRGAAVIPFAGPMAAEAGESFGRGEVGRGAVQTVAAIEGRPRFGELGPQVTGAGAVREVMGEGASKARVLADQHAHAVATKQHLTDLAGAVHSDAQNAMSQVLAKVDEAKPGGAFSKADIQGKVKTAVGDLVQVPEKLPPSLNKILKTEEAAAPGGPKGPAASGRQLSTENPAAYQRMKASGAYTPEEIKYIEGGGDNLTAEQLKQMRSDVGQELGRYGEKGVVGAALKKTYGILSSELRGAAKDVGIEKDWLEANNKYSQYSNDFTRKGPLKVALNNQTAAGIMEPLTGTARQVVMDTLQKYKDAGFNVDTDWLEGQMRHYSMGKTVTRLSQPTKMDLLMAGFSPKALAIRQLGPRIFRNPKVLSRFSGAEDVPMPTREVYPSKAAAMKAKKP